MRKLKRKTLKITRFQDKLYKTQETVKHIDE